LLPLQLPLIGEVVKFGHCPHIKLNCEPNAVFPNSPFVWLVGILEPGWAGDLGAGPSAHAGDCVLWPCLGLILGESLLLWPTIGSCLLPTCDRTHDGSFHSVGEARFYCYPPRVFVLPPQWQGFQL
jgi:hypothetical protein